jgi:sulfate/thiosulfate transport system substrate-binding protein
LEAQLRRSLAVLALLAVAVAVPASAARNSTNLSLVAYSTPTVAFSKLISAFQQTPAGKDVQFQQSYGASEVQAKAVLAGLSADVVDFSLQPDMDSLVKAGLVAKTWNKNASSGFVTKSVVVFVLRNGNPKHIKTWDDLIKPGVQVVTANPFTSGGARWNVMAAYGSQLREGKTPKQATAYLNTLFHHVVSQDTSGRNALNTFLSGRGDVLLTYENEAILAQQQGKPVYYLIPKATLQIENPVAVLSNSKNKPQANAFVKFLYSPAGQKIWADNGYRPVLQSVAKQYAKQFPPRPQLFKIGYVGGWPKVTKQFFDPDTGVMAKIERGLGVSTSG